MKTKNLFWVLLIFVFIMGMTGCDPSKECLNDYKGWVVIEKSQDYNGFLEPSNKYFYLKDNGDCKVRKVYAYEIDFYQYRMGDTIK